MNDTDNQQKRLMDINSLAGIIEGEGCFTIQIRDNRGTKSYTPLVQITNTNPLIILKAAKIMKELGLPRYIYLQKQGDYKLCYRIVSLGIKRVKHVLDVIAPYIECRRDQLETLRSFVESKLSHARQALLTSIEQEALDKLRQLNRPYLFSETARMPQELSEMLQSDLSGDTKTAPAVA